MLRIELPDNIKDSGLALPTSTPRTLVEVDSESLPYACQCPCCGSLFNIPEGLLYKVEEDTLLDGDFGAEAAEAEAAGEVEGEIPDSVIDESPAAGPTESSAAGVGESDDTFV